MGYSIILTVERFEKASKSKVWGESRRAFNVQNFTATLNKTGVAHASHFEVQITGLFVSTGAEQNLMLRCDTVDILEEQYLQQNIEYIWTLRKVHMVCIY